MIIPEWFNPSSIALVWPEHLPSGVGSRIKGFYRDFILLLLENDVSVQLLHSNIKDLQKLKNYFGQDNITFQHEPNVSDIWIRDFGPVFTIIDGNLIPIKTLYQPSYAYSEVEIKWFEENNLIGYKLTDTKPSIIKCGERELILDGGNLIHNGFGTAIVTNRIISDNEHLFEEEIRETLKANLGIEELFIIPSEPGDDTGHIDGMVRFLDQNTLAVIEYLDPWVDSPFNIFNDEYDHSKEVTEKIAKYLSDKNFNIVRIPNSIPRKGKHKVKSLIKGKSTFENAAGNYLNYLRAGNKLFVSQYSNPVDDDRAYEKYVQYSKYFHPEMEIIKVPLNATPLAEYGGIINCITLQLYDEKAINYHPFNQFMPIAYEEKGENNVSVIYFALKDSVNEKNDEYYRVKVVQADLYNKTISGPNILERFYPYRTPFPIDPSEDEYDEFFQQLFLFPSSEIRKLWNLFRTENL